MKNMFVQCKFGGFQMTNFKEELKKILEPYIYYDPIEHVDTDDELNDKRTEEMLKEVISSITELVKSIVPEERYKNYAGSGNISWAIEESKKTGFNSCRSEILKRLD